MNQEQVATLSGLETALRMEEDGKAFYLKAAKLSKNDIGKKLFKNLAAEEDIHKEVFKRIYKKIKDKNQWPEDTELLPEQRTNIKTVFAAEMENMSKKSTPAKAELDAVNRRNPFYRGETAGARLKKLYEALSMQESEHARVLQDYYEFYLDPASFYRMKENSSLDGG